MTREQVEAYHTRNRYPTALDVYQFGLVMWEAFSGVAPWRQLNNRGRDMLKELFTRDFLARPEFPDLVEGDDRRSVYPQIKALTEQCWHFNPELRPDARTLHNDLRTLFGLQTKFSTVIVNCNTTET